MSSRGKSGEREVQAYYLRAPISESVINGDRMDILIILDVEQDLPTRILATGDFDFLTNRQRIANIALEDKPT